MISLSSLVDFSKIKVIAMLLGFVCLLQVVYCDSTNSTSYFAASIEGMEPLLETERQLLNAMENYSILLDRKLSVIRNAITEMRAENQKSVSYAEEYLSNPINTYALIRRLHEDWASWQLFLQSSVGTDEISRIEKLRTEAPSNDDLSYVTEAIHRLQVVSDLKPADMAIGIFNGRQYDVRFSSMDCYSIGYELFSKYYYNPSATWLNVSLQLFQDSDMNAVHDFEKTKIYETYTKVLQKQGRLADALEAVRSALHLSPHKTNLLQAKSEIEFQIQNEISTEIKKEEVQSGKHLYTGHRSECRHNHSNRLSNQHCLYNRTASPFLYLAPFKMEILHLDPYLILYHDFISDAEIALLKELARPDLKSATVYDTSKKKLTVNTKRNAKVAIIPVDANDLSIRLNQRIADMTGFDLKDSRTLQVINYGLGGNFEPHYDFFGKPEVHNDGEILRERIATLLIYLSDVDQGGATVFPRIKTSVKPQKGSALLWYDLDIESSGDNQTLHASCPVMVGSKWGTFRLYSMTLFGSILYSFILRFGIRSYISFSK